MRISSSIPVGSIAARLVLMIGFLVVFAYLVTTAKERAENIASLELRYVDNEAPIILIKTEEGYIGVTLEPWQAPMSVYSFMSLAGRGFYNGSFFDDAHSQLQGGERRESVDRIPPNVQRVFSQTYYEVAASSLEKGDVLLVNYGPDKHQYHFLIVTKPSPELVGKYARLGKVTAGMEVAEKIVSEDSKTAFLAKIEKVILK